MKEAREGVERERENSKPADKQQSISVTQKTLFTNFRVVAKEPFGGCTKHDHWEKLTRDKVALAKHSKCYLRIVEGFCRMVSMRMTMWLTVVLARLDLSVDCRGN